MIIDPETKSVTLDSFQWQGATLRIIGTKRVDEMWYHYVKNEATSEVKEKTHEWIEKLNDRIKNTG